MFFITQVVPSKGITGGKLSERFFFAAQKEFGLQKRPSEILLPVPGIERQPRQSFERSVTPGGQSMH